MCIRSNSKMKVPDYQLGNALKQADGWGCKYFTMRYNCIVK